ncbi:MAG: alpha/beta hydrolase [Flavisolibacter sp.]
MLIRESSTLIVEQTAIASLHLKRYVIVDIYMPRIANEKGSVKLLLINDGQDLEEMKFASLLDEQVASGAVKPLVCIGIHAGKNRLHEYGVAGVPDYEGRGSLAAEYQRFITEELLPQLLQRYGWDNVVDTAISGFSLGGLSALDTALNHPAVFNKTGVFSGSLWWRSQALGEDYSDDLHRIIHQKVRSEPVNAGLRFYFTTGSLDETADRNNNGVIDSIDDTQDLVKELRQKGYSNGDITYVNYPEGRHDIMSWGKAMPGFLKWGWGEED